jgi:transcriptional regulator with XRE-family HTH domain
MPHNPEARQQRCTIAAFPLYRFGGKCAMAKAPRFTPTFIRQWRQHRGMSLDVLAARVPMDKGNLSKVERGILPYNQEMLERLADALMTDPASLLMRDPSAPEAIWSLWERARPGVRRQIESVAETLIRTGTDN